MPFSVIKKGLVLLEWKYFPTPKILDPQIFRSAVYQTPEPQGDRLRSALGHSAEPDTRVPLVGG
ncbi:hypothetical protein [Lentilactobacillus buchneri]|uniref:hypothetical protein n=1 Tax=Lentilactobacillus buchneri TaxID=1581 RepID=UPI001CDCF62C|nr:hypothetical protein [Lentilactobacillus buchneri]